MWTSVTSIRAPGTISLVSTAPVKSTAGDGSIAVIVWPAPSRVQPSCIVRVELVVQSPVSVRVWLGVSMATGQDPRPSSRSYVADSVVVVTVMASTQPDLPDQEAELVSPMTHWMSPKAGLMMPSVKIPSQVSHVL